MAKKRVPTVRPTIPRKPKELPPVNNMESFSREDLQEMLEKMEHNRSVLVENANRQISQLDGAIGFVTQLLAGDLELPELPEPEEEETED